jgi:Ca2+-binding RTX toxin-like protein
MTTTRRFAPIFETLEDRLMQTTAGLSNGLLFVNGTPAGDSITIRQINDVIRISGVARGYWASQVQGIVVDGQSGNDTIYLSNPSLESGVQHIMKPTLIAGGYGNDTIVGGSSVDIVAGGAGNDVIFGLWGDDLLMGGDGQDEIYGGYGNDRIYGQAATDWLYGGDGVDYLDGGAGADLLDGGAGRDLLYGGADYATDVFNNPDASDLFFTNYGEDKVYWPSYRTYNTVARTSSVTPTTSYTNPGRGIISQMLSPLAGGPADSVYRSYAEGRFTNMFSRGA